MLLVGSFESQNIISERYRLDALRLNLQRDLEDLQKYASAIGDGTVSVQDLATVPGNYFNRMSIFLMSSSGAAMAGARQKFGYVMAMNQPNMVQVPAQYQEQYKQYMFKNLYEQERKRFSDIEVKLLNEKEKKIQQKITDIETQLKMLDKKEEGVKEVVKASIDRLTPTFGLK